MGLIIGGAAPWFITQTRQTPTFHFSAAGGRYVLLALLPDEEAARAAAMAALTRRRGLFDDQRISAFGVLRDRAAYEGTVDQLPGLRWMFDPEGDIARAYDSLDAEGRCVGRWVLIDPTLRVLDVAPAGEAERIMAQIEALGRPEDHAGTPIHAPVLIVPRVFEPELCRRLIDLYETAGGRRSGVMRERDGRTVSFLDDTKRRSDAVVEDEALKATVRERIGQRLAPQIKRAFQFGVTRIERYIVACYDSQEGGFFRAHRDNTTAGTAHRRFACSINLNAEEFEGGDLMFPEYGPKTYRPPTGGAVVFSCSLLHEATPVTGGRRYAFLPFLFDEAAEKIRQANNALIDSAPSPAPSLEA